MEAIAPGASPEENPVVAALIRAIEVVGGQSRLAKAIGCKQQHVWNWVHRDEKPAAEYVLAIEAATAGEVSRHELRPDVFGPRPAAATGQQAAA